MEQFDGKMWLPNYRGSMGQYKLSQEECSHPWDKRLTSLHRRIYCGLCNVSFELWIKSNA